MDNPHSKFFIPNLTVIIVGGIFLIWYYFIDGKLFDKPITYINGVDPMNYQVDKDTYTVGETPNILTAFCKNREAQGSIEWTLIDGQKVGYARKEPREIPVGCYPSKEGGLIESPVEKIPLYIEPTCDAHFVGVVHRELPGGREVVENVKTEKFCVVNNIEPLQDLFKE